MRPLRIVPWVALALWPVIAGAQSVSGAWTTYLRPSTFTSVIAEADTVWCASSDAGLLTYTPSRRDFSFELREPGGLASNLLTALELDRRRQLWVGTRGAGVSVLSADRSRWSLVNAFDGLRSDTVTTLMAQGDTMWIGTTAGLALWDGLRVEGTLPDGVNPSPFASDVIIGFAPLGDSLWVATAGGVYVGRLSQGLSTWSTANGGLPSLSITRMVNDGLRPFALTANVVRRWNESTGLWVSTGDIGFVRSLTAARGEILAASSSGLYQWNGTAWALLDAALASSTVSPLVATLDETGRGYAAGRPSSSPDAGGNGIYREAVPGPWTFDYPPGPPGNNCVNLEVQGSSAYVTTEHDGIGRLRNGTWTQWFPTAVNHPGPERFYQPLFSFGLLVDAAGDKWVASWAPAPGCDPDTGSIDVLDDSGPTDQFRHIILGPVPADARRSFARGTTVDHLGGRWFGMVSPCAEDIGLAPAGLEYYAPDGSYGGNYSIANAPPLGQLTTNLIPSLATDRNGQVWVGSGAGLLHFTPSPTNPMPSITRLTSTSQLSINALATYGDSVWALNGSDLKQYSLGGTLRGSYDVPGSQSTQAVRPMDVGLDGTLWLGTSVGVRAYHRGRPAEDITTANSPLVNNDVHTIRVDRATGRVWMATGGGVSVFDPNFVPPHTELDQLSFSVYPNPGRLTALGVPIRLSGNGVSYQGTIYDVSGRRVQRFSIPANGRIVWDCRDEHGELVRPGIYFVRAESGGLSGVQRLVLLH